MGTPVVLTELPFVDRLVLVKCTIYHALANENINAAFSFLVDVNHVVLYLRVLRHFLNWISKSLQAALRSA